MFKVGQVLEEFKGVEDGASIAILENYLVIYYHVNSLSDREREVICDENLCLKVRHYKNVINVRLGTTFEDESVIFADICYNPHLSPQIEYINGYCYCMLLVVVDAGTGMVELIRVEGVYSGIIARLDGFIHVEKNSNFDLESYNENVEVLWNSSSDTDFELKNCVEESSDLHGKLIVDEVIASNSTKMGDWWH